MKSDRYFEFARHVAEMSDFERAKVGAVAVLKDKVISTGHNSHKSHPLQKKYNQFRNFRDCGYINHSLHAEVACLLPLIDTEVDFSKVHLYVYRIRKDRPHGLARPCEACRKLLFDLGVRNVSYTTDCGVAEEHFDNRDGEKHSS